MSTKKVFQPRRSPGGVLLFAPLLDFWEPVLVRLESRLGQLTPWARWAIHEVSPSDIVRVLHAPEKTALKNSVAKSAGLAIRWRQNSDRFERHLDQMAKELHRA